MGCALVIRRQNGVAKSRGQSLAQHLGSSTRDNSDHYRDESDLWILPFVRALRFSYDHELCAEHVFWRCLSRLVYFPGRPDHFPVFGICGDLRFYLAA